jgi:hypothetical protein
MSVKNLKIADKLGMASTKVMRKHLIGDSQAQSK